MKNLAQADENKLIRYMERGQAGVQGNRDTKGAYFWVLHHGPHCFDLQSLDAMIEKFCDLVNARERSGVFRVRRAGGHPSGWAIANGRSPANSDLYVCHDGKTSAVCSENDVFATAAEALLALIEYHEPEQAERNGEPDDGWEVVERDDGLWDVTDGKYWLTPYGKLYVCMSVEYLQGIFATEWEAHAALARAREMGIIPPPEPLPEWPTGWRIGISGYLAIAPNGVRYGHVRLIHITSICGHDNEFGQALRALEARMGKTS